MVLISVPGGARSAITDECPPDKDIYNQLTSWRVLAQTCYVTNTVPCNRCYAARGRHIIVQVVCQCYDEYAHGKRRRNDVSLRFLLQWLQYRSKHVEE